MKQDKIVTSYGGIGFLGLLTILFITLKLIGIINWSWFWVLSPIIIPPLLFILFILVIIIIFKRM